MCSLKAGVYRSFYTHVFRSDSLNLSQESGHSEEKPRRRTEGSFVSQHASFWENHAPNIQNATPTRQRTNIPGRYTGDKEKLTATRQKFMQNAAAASDTTSASAPRFKAESGEDGAPKKIVRGRADFNQLLQKFSGSESNSEKSDTDAGSSISGIPRRRSLVKRQEAKEVVSSSGESDARRTPERTQSLKLPSRREDGLAGTVSESSRATSNVSQGVSTVPGKVSSVPEKVSSLPGKVSSVPEKVSSVPEKVFTVPGKASAISEKVSSVSEKSSIFRSEFMNRKFSQKSTDIPQDEKEEVQDVSSAGIKAHPEAKTETGELSASSSRPDTEGAVKGGGLMSRVSNIQRSSEKTSERSASFQNKSEDVTLLTKADSTSSVTSTENLIKHVEPITTRDSKKPEDKAINSGTHAIFGYKVNEAVRNDEGTSLPTTITRQPELQHSAPDISSANLSNTLTTSRKTSQEREQVLPQSKSSVQSDIKLGLATTLRSTAPKVSDTASTTEPKTSTKSKESADKKVQPLLSSLESEDKAKISQPMTETLSLESSTKVSTTTNMKTPSKIADLPQQKDSIQAHPRSSLEHDTKPPTTATTASITSASRVAGTTVTKISNKPTDLEQQKGNHSSSSLHDNTKLVSILNTTTASSTSEVTSTALTVTSSTPTDSARNKEHFPIKPRNLLERDLEPNLKSAAAISLDSLSKASEETNTSISKETNKSDDSKQSREHPVARPRGSLERVIKESLTTTSSVDSIPEVHQKTDSKITKTSNTPTETVQHKDQAATSGTTVEREDKQFVNSLDSATNMTSSAPSRLPTSASSLEIQSSGSSSGVSTPSSNEIRRASSFKEATVSRTDSMEKRKGILKRNTSLNKHDVSDSSSSIIIDPQLAKILMQRKQMVGDATEQEALEAKMGGLSDVLRRTRRLSAAEEIEETLRYSQQKATERGLNPEEDEGLKRVSVAERVYSMQTKIEENVQTSVITRSRSGLSTPRSRPRSGVMTPTSQKSFDETVVHQQTSLTSSVTEAAVPVTCSDSVLATQPRKQQTDSGQSAVSGPQLMEKLNKIANDAERYQEKRHRFQHRKRNDWRYQTQPVTYEEIQAADSLETVSAFRALVRKHTSINAFDQFKAESAKVTKQLSPVGGKKPEFPQHLSPPSKLSRRSRKLRHRTLPVTAEELNAVPEHQMLVTDPDWVKFDELEKRDSKADSGILSGSDADSLYQAESLRSLTLEMDVSEGDPSRMSVTDKASMFRILEERTKAEKDKEKSASGAKRYINRKKRERSQTMPITDEEVKSASEMGETRNTTMSSSTRSMSVNLPQPEVVNRSRSPSITENGDKENSEDELTKLSLSEKVKLFSQPREAEKQPAKAEPPVVRRRNRKLTSRFSTQPVTTEEVEKAAAFSRISPLAMSMVKPPDPEILKGLPLKDQRELMAQHAEMFLSQTSLRSRSGSNTSQSQPPSRRASVNMEEGAVEAEKNGILKDKSASAKDLHDVKSILKTEPVKAKSESEVHSILKLDVKHVTDPSLTSSSSEPRGILKKTKSEDIGGVECGEDIKGILKHVDSDEEECHGKPRSRSNSQPLGILKTENLSQSVDHSLEIKGILKAPSQESVHETTVIKSAMRRGSFETDPKASSGSVLKSALRGKSRNSMDLDDSQSHVVISDLHSTGHGLDLNSNNSNRQVGPAVPVSAQRIDHMSTATLAKQVTSSLSTNISTSIQTSATTFTSTLTTTTASVSTLQVPEGSDDRSGQSASDDGESSSGELLEGTPRGSKLKRKSRFSDRTTKSERYKTQPPELTDSASSTTTGADTTPRRKFKYEGRHRTQPITPDEMREAEAATPATNLTHTPGGSIADRLNQLKTSGEEEWKKRVGKKDDILATPEIIKLRDKSALSEHRPTSIADRLSEMETSMTKWKERVEESDAKQFTVAGKLTHGPTDSPLVNKLRNLPRKDEPSSKNSSPLSSPVTPTKEFIAKIPLPKDIVQDTSVIVKSVKETPSGDDETEAKREPVKVEVPDMGEEVASFFAVKPLEEITDKVEIEVDDFNNIFIEAEMILPTVRKVRPNRKVRPTSHNPLKTMSQKLEIRQEYTEVIYGTAEKELKRVKKEGLAKEAGFAQAALAGLASKENFKQVELRRTDSGSSVHGQAFDPFKEIMLLHVKGRRLVQTRLVEPHARSINEGDCYILVTPEKVIHWEGQYANVIEKAKASEIASYIQQKKDLGCKKANEVSTVPQVKDNLGAGKHFWAALEGEKQIQACGPDTEDELYEASINKCNMVYKLEGNALQPYEEYWGAIPKYEMLKKNEVIIFDFGTEFYVWQGKTVTMEQRKLGLKLAKQLYEKGYDYTESAINPLSPLRTEDNDGLPLSSPTRPTWAIFGKVNQNMETILFREKFADWPDSSRLIGVKGHGTVETVNKELLELKAFDAKRMIPLNTAPVTLKLEGANLGRGVKWSEDMQGFVKEQDIITLEVTVWHVLEYDHYKLPAQSHGQFHDGDTYVVRWQYMISNANLRSLKGNAARNSMMGRERCAYFFWQGNQSTINEKGASALMTVELDEERGPQVRVLQGKEPPCFLNLFGGKMILHIGKREDPTTNTQGSWRLYCLRGDYENEMYLMEIPVSVHHFRSRSSMILLNVKTGMVYVWHGAKSPKHIRELCLKAVSRLKENTPLEVGLHEKATITAMEVEEGEEKREIWSALDRQDRTVYHSLLTDSRPHKHTLRLFHMSSVNLVFEVHEQLNPARVPDLTTPFPFLQSDLYKATQPALFLIDNDFEVYLWQGWWPIGSHDTENVQTGSAIARFNLDRRLAMETTLHYCKEKNPRKPPTAFLVCAGVEPVRFTSLFPHWEEDSIVKEMAVEEGKTPGYIEQVSEILHRLTETRYTLAELQERPLPDGVDPLKLEAYLYDADFEEILEMTREEFYGQPHWKQIDLKKHVGLF